MSSTSLPLTSESNTFAGTTLKQRTGISFVPLFRLTSSTPSVSGSPAFIASLYLPAWSCVSVVEPWAAPTVPFFVILMLATTSSVLAAPVESSTGPTRIVRAVDCLSIVMRLPLRECVVVGCPPRPPSRTPVAQLAGQWHPRLCRVA